MSAAFSTLSRLFQIQSDNVEVQRKGRLLQILVTSLTFTALAQAVIMLFRQGQTGSATGFPPNLAQALFALLLGTICLLIIRYGRPRVAAHAFFITLDIIFFAQLITTPAPNAYPYLMLIAIVAIATLDSVGASVAYSIVTVTAVSFYIQISGGTTSDSALAYVVTALGISLTTWITAGDLQKTLLASDELTEELQGKTDLLQWRTRQLQLGAEIGQVTSTRLDQDKLLRDIVQSISEQFGFYHVSIFLLDEKKQLVLREATGKIGATLKEKRYRLPINSQSIIGWVATHRQARITLDVDEDPVYMIEPLLTQTRSELALPLIARGEIIGVLDVQSRAADAFKEEDIAILQIMANQVAVNIDNARLFAQIETRLNETKALLDLNKLLTTTLDAGEMYRRAARAFTEKLNVTRCAISSWEREADTVTTQVEFIRDWERHIIDEYDIEHQSYPLAEHTGTRQVLQTHEPLIRYASDPELEKSEQQILLEMEQATCLEIPLVRGQEAIGIVELYRSNAQPVFTPGEIQLAQTMANQIAVALDNASLTSEARGRVAQLSTLNRMSMILSLAPTLKDIFKGARREIMSVIEATGMSISLLTPEGDTLNWIYGFEYGQEVDLSNIPPLPITEGFSGHVARTRAVLYISQDAEELHEQFQSRTVGASANAWLGLPMIVANELIGVLAVENDAPFSERAIELLKTIAGPLAIAIHNLIQFERVQAALAAQSEQRIQLQTAAEVAAATTSILERDVLMQQAVDLIKERFGLYYAGLFLVNRDTNEAVLQTGTGEAGRVQLEQRHRLSVGGRSLIGGATGDGVPRITQDVTLDEEWRPNPHLPDTRSELALPLRVRGDIIGALTVQSVEPDAFGPELIGTLQIMSDQLAIAIENTRLLARAETRARQQQRLNRISTRLHRSADVNEIIRIGLGALSEQFTDNVVELTLGNRSTE